MLDSATRVDNSGGFTGRYPQAPDASPVSNVGFSFLGGSATNSSVTILPNDTPTVPQNYAVANTQHQPASKNTGKIEAIDATVRDIGEQFVLVTAAPGGETVEIQIPLELCPSEIQFEGMPISISIDTSSRYSSLKVERRDKKAALSDDFRSRFAAMTEWADSL